LIFASLQRLAGAVVVCAATFAASAVLAASPPQPDGPADMAKVLAPGALPELAMGSASAPITVVEYGSLTCPHCAAFSKETFPLLKAQYIDTGKVRFIFREFSRNTLDVAGFLLARCLGDDKAYAADELLFATQDKWAFVDKPIEPLIASLRAAGMTDEKAQECLKNQKLANDIVDIQKRANTDIKLTGTPTFVINGKVYGGELSFDQIKAILDSAPAK
jgi:protein-disulfide isomerase